MLYSIGKDLNVMRDFARKAYYREKPLFPSLPQRLDHLDGGTP